MNRRRLIALFSWMVITVVVVIGCTPVPAPESTTPTASSQTVELTVSAAASLQDALTAIQPSYEAAHPGIALVYNFGSSGSLQQQIEQGAPVDVFLSASLKQMNALNGQGLLLENTQRDLLKNQIVLITPLDKRDVASFEDLSQATVSKISIGDPDSVPAGQYGKETLESLELYASVQPKIVFAKDVRQVLSYVETGNVDAGLVYSSEAQISDQVKVVATASEDSHSPILYAGAVVAESVHPNEARSFLDFLSSDEAIAIFKSYGFLIAS